MASTLQDFLSAISCLIWKALRSLRTWTGHGLVLSKIPITRLPFPGHKIDVRRSVIEICPIRGKSNDPNFRLSMLSRDRRLTLWQYFIWRQHEMMIFAWFCWHTLSLNLGSRRGFNHPPRALGSGNAQPLLYHTTVLGSHEHLTILSLI